MNEQGSALTLSELSAADLPFLLELWHKPEAMHYAVLLALTCHHTGTMRRPNGCTGKPVSSDSRE